MKKGSIIPLGACNADSAHQIHRIDNDMSHTCSSVYRNKLLPQGYCMMDNLGPTISPIVTRIRNSSITAIANIRLDLTSTRATFGFFLRFSALRTF